MKKKFIVYTLEGHTVSPTGDDIDNAQILGWSSGWDAEHAIEALFDDNPGLESEVGFDRKFAKAEELV